MRLTMVMDMRSLTSLVKQIHKERLSCLYKSIPIHKVKYIGIDEFSLSPCNCVIVV